MPGSEIVRTRFVILAAPRTGSNMLCTLLDSHPEILCHHEVFNPTGIYYALGLRDGSFNLGTLAERDRDPLAFLGRLWASDQGHTCVGFKMTHRQNEAVFLSLLANERIKKIVLRRRNRVRTFVSRKIAETTGVWEAYHPADLPQVPPPVHVNMEQLVEHIRQDEAYYAGIDGSLRASGQEALPMSYEDLMNVDARRIALRFLEVGDGHGAGLTVKSIRQNPAPLAELVSNFDELEQSLCQQQRTDLASELRQ
jgi:hypothetical protein